ncbi:hypothetical protein C0Q70_08284 [Pomacea canaliculata]|uniref:Uncharacterized protein n=2 Tax=Pomacea canaliculata TaxID=400727 RepID=A0A2T7PHF5_POMCA|nr:hypothetical protein C0Q70_08284 [Pomacea canaliculata]
MLKEAILEEANTDDRETMPHENPLNLESEDKAETEMLKEAILEEANTDDRETMPHENPLNLESEDKAETETPKEVTSTDGNLDDRETMPHENPLNLESEDKAETETPKEVTSREANTETMVNEGVIPALETVEIHVDDIEGGEDVLVDGELYETMAYEESLNLESEAEGETEMLKEMVLEEIDPDIETPKEMIPNEADMKTETMMNEGEIPVLEKSPNINVKIKIKPSRKRMHSFNKENDRMLAMQIDGFLGLQRPTVDEQLRRQQAKDMMRFMLGKYPISRLLRHIQSGSMTQTEVGINQGDSQPTVASPTDKGKESRCSTCSTEIVSMLQQPRRLSSAENISQTTGTTRLQEETLPIVAATAGIIFWKESEKVQEKSQQAGVMSSQNLIGNASQSEEYEHGRAATQAQVDSSNVENNDYAGKRSRRSSSSLVKEGSDEISLSGRQKNDRVKSSHADDGDTMDENGRSLKEGIHGVLRSALRKGLRRHENAVYMRHEAEDDYVSNADGIAGDAVSASGVDEVDAVAMQIENREPLMTTLHIRATPFGASGVLVVSRAAMDAGEGQGHAKTKVVVRPKI